MHPFAHRSSPLLRSALVVLALALCWAPAGPAREDYSRLLVQHQGFSLTSSDSASVDGLYAHATGPGGIASRLIVATPDGRTWTLTSRLEPSTGLETLRLEDAASGWWLERVQDEGLREPDLGRYMERALRNPETWERPSSVVVSARGGFRLALTLPATADGAKENRLQAAFAAGTASEPLRAEVPTGLLASLAFLAAQCPEAATLEGSAPPFCSDLARLTGLLAAVLAEKWTQVGVSASAWEYEATGKPVASAEVSRPEWLGLLGRAGVGNPILPLEALTAPRAP
jgi:hypothetical protein